MPDDEPQEHNTRLVAWFERNTWALRAGAGVLVLGNIYSLYDTVANPVTVEEIEAYGRPYFMWETASGLMLIATFSFLLVSAWLARRAAREPKPLIPDRPEDDKAIRRKRDAKRFNERLKLSATFLNGIGASSFLAGAITPMLTRQGPDGTSALYGLGIGVVCHLLGQAALSLWKTEE